MELETAYWDGELVIAVQPREARMSHWIHAPRAWRSLDGQMLFDLTDSDWDLYGVSGDDEDCLVLALRRYPGAGPLVRLTIARGSLDMHLEGRSLPADDLLQQLQAWTDA
ncbi:hypothetical protein [Bordetella holmesii]|uniref:Uncharacterized protein n=2 Tax=Bordetella holmesii TaxID=35814 RepID=A0A158M5L9_9BORD|nr:hypothetical protein [Bordetella holmesii]AHV91473.1 hypothetical protein D560_0919 [Bordetella holmesii ATCC 51541]AIT25582.1 hypothetical protein D558_0902 [Bordetella holmesii 44057]EWM44196.1 hypothetical protein D556_0912 [Bordetella holmesii 41130]EWM46150.1 hypothetical protein D555_0923 [Bordetella holmesii 35009]EWM50305.1 hypothetical protein D557_0148 [Bordetella holmesii 70147]